MATKSFKLIAEDDTEFGSPKVYKVPPTKIKEKLKEVTVVEPPTEEITNLLGNIEANKIAFDKAEAALESINAEIKRIGLELGKGEKTVETKKYQAAIDAAMSAVTKLLYNNNIIENEFNTTIAHNNRLFLLLEEPGKSIVPPATIDRFIGFIKSKDSKLAKALSTYQKKFPAFLESIAEVKKSVITGYSIERTKSVEELLKKSYIKIAAEDIVESFKFMFNSIKDLFSSTDEILQAIMEVNNEVAELEDKLRSAV